MRSRSGRLRRLAGGLLLPLALLAGMAAPAAAAATPGDPPLPAYPGLPSHAGRSASAAVDTTPVPCDNNGADKSMSRGQTLVRARSWLAVGGVPYSQNRCYRNQYGDYRTDCSGFVAMIWGLGGSGSAFWTGNLNTRSHVIPRSELTVGDALLRHENNADVDHVAMFVKWHDAAHTQPWVIEQTGPTTVERRWDAGYANLYTPVRYDNITEDEQPQPPAAAAVFGEAEGAPSAGRHADGRLELFPVSNAGGVRHIYETKPSGPWDGPFNFSPGVPVRQTLPVNHGDGRMEVFAVGTDGSVWNRFETTAGGPWSGWNSCAPAGAFSSVFAARHHNSSRLEIFGVKPDGSIWNKYESKVNGPWSEWNVYYAETDANLKVKYATVGVHADNRLEVFAVTADGSVRMKYEITPDGRWSDWESFGPAGTAAHVKVGRHGSGRMEVFAVKADGSIWNKFEGTAGGTWSGWNGFAGAGTVRTDPRALNVSNHHGGRLELFAVKPDGAVVNKVETAVDGPWRDWENFAPAGHAVTINAARHSDNRLEVFATAADGSILNKYESAPNAAWSAWNPYLPA